MRTALPPGHSASKMNSAAVSNDGPTRVRLFPFPPHQDSAGDVCITSDTPAPVLAEVKNNLSPRSGRDGFVYNNAGRLLAYRAVMVGAIDVEVVEVGIVDADNE
jgi:hypothetical protein